MNRELFGVDLLRKGEEKRSVAYGILEGMETLKADGKALYLCGRPDRLAGDQLEQMGLPHACCRPGVGGSMLRFFGVALAVVSLPEGGALALGRNEGGARGC